MELRSLFLILALIIIPLSASVAEFRGGGVAAADAATGIDIAADGTLEVTGVADTSVDINPDDDDSVNKTIQWVAFIRVTQV